jgi:hypothetical protein
MVTVAGLGGQVFPAEHVAIQVAGIHPGAPRLTATTSETGAYAIENIPPGRYILAASGPGFKTSTITLSILAGQVTIQNLRLEVAPIRQQIEVHARVPLATPEHVAPAAKLTPSQVETAPVLHQKTLQELPLLPAVIRTPQQETYIEGLNESSGMFEIDNTEAVDPVTGSFIVDLPVDAIQTLQVNEAPFAAKEGGFLGGLTSVSTKAPVGAWQLRFRNLFPHVFAEEGQLIGAKVLEPRVYLTGPLWKGKLNFSEAFMYELNRDNVRGLPWPNNVSTTTGVNSYTTLQALLSGRHVLTGHIQFFPQRQVNANIGALIPIPASENYGQRGFSGSATDRLTRPSGITFTTMIHFLGVHNYAHAQGRLDMLVTPTGFDGNYFNDWTRSSNQEEAEEEIGLAPKRSLGRHNLTFGVYENRRSYGGTNVSRPIKVLSADNGLVESISFTGGSPLSASTTEASAYASDQWTVNRRFAVNLGFRGTSQTVGSRFSPAPRISVVFNPDRQDKTIIRAGEGVFYDRISLLAPDFSSNPERTVTVFGANSFSTPSSETQANRCAESSGTGIQLLANCSDFSTTPYSNIWRVELTRQITSKLRARIGYLWSSTFDNFVAGPTRLPSSGSTLLLTNTGSSRYRQFEAALDYVPNQRTHIYATYIHSQSRGDLNSLGELFGTFWQPIIQPNVFANLPSDVPDRFTALGTTPLPWKITFSPSIDLQSGFPYSNFNLREDYVGVPNSLRFPTYFTFGFSVYRELRLPFFRRRRFRVGVFSLNTTNRPNPTAVYSNIGSPYFGHFTGPEKRINGFIFDIVH